MWENSSKYNALFRLCCFGSIGRKHRLPRLLCGEPGSGPIMSTVGPHRCLLSDFRALPSAILLSNYIPSSTLSNRRGPLADFTP